MMRDAAARMRPIDTTRDAEALAYGREVIRAEARALEGLAEQLDGGFLEAVAMIHNCRGAVIVTGIGKAGMIGQKLTATFASTGARAHFLHPAEAFHGDLGRVHNDDVVLALSQSGESSEVVQLLPAFKQFGVKIIAVTANHTSTLGRAAAVVLPLGKLQEACSLGLAPSTSTTAMLALGDALALAVSRQRGFRAEDFARFHPGGSLGLKLSGVDDHMRPIAECRVASANQSIREVLVTSTRPGRRSGAIMLLDADGRLSGLFTDSDLARLIERRSDAALDRPISEVMINAPTTVCSGERMTAAIEILTARKFSELPVVDQLGRPLGMIDVTDVVGMLPERSQPGVMQIEGYEEGDWEAPVVRLFAGEEDEQEFSWPFAELPETD
ncbi:KpsF/GutQ family sugar-phosphate isomerase [Lacipirellula parvula]|uniref:D-arabinose 5-phosphate isomerase n=1 Tax=Lacipirellula parvula TaxID=2650471 RepID=A0A5K7XJD8_9BACT|nr:KpsF/GutQ family sugar-phosphate isomerase [Lacipirellula parvula]BBO36495.1 D-arabinose 5-phosphate isomerase [Lacipirellula parvula]